MLFHFKFIVCIFSIAFCEAGHSYTKELSIDQIYQFRSKKVKKSRQFYGKKFLTKKLGKNSNFLANNVVDMSSRLGCDLVLQKIIRKALGKKSKKKGELVSFACKVKQRER